MRVYSTWVSSACLMPITLSVAQAGCYCSPMLYALEFVGAPILALLVVFLVALITAVVRGELRIGPLIVSRLHPHERQLRRWGQLTPALRELVARAARSVATDHLQDLYEAHGLPFSKSDRTAAVVTRAIIDTAMKGPSGE